MPLGKDLAWATLPQPPGAPRALNNAQHAALYYASELALHINIYELPDGQFAAVPARPPPAHSSGAQGGDGAPINLPAPPHHSHRQQSQTTQLSVAARGSGMW